MKYNPTGGKTYTLAASIGSTDTSILLTSFLEPVTATPLTMSNMNTDIVYATIAPKTAQSEFISFTGITQNIDGTALLTGVVRGLAKKYPLTTNAAYKLPHSGTTSLILSDAPQVFANYANKAADEHITGLWTFDQFPITPSNPLATEVVYGIAKLSVAAVDPTKPIVVGDNDTRLSNSPTAGQKLALVGTQGVPTTGNEYVTKDNVYTADTDQTQVTQNATVETGMAITTGNKNVIAQSFVPAKTKIRGVKLYKSADTGTFTGTVTVSLKADSAGSPTGAALATVTVSNANWLLLPVGEFQADFSAEYSMSAGTLYWIIVSTSTSDNSNHPNLGTNSAGGYANGSVKYYNGTDNWVAISTIDLYFKTLQGVSSQLSYIPTSPIVRVYTPSATLGNSSTQFNITNPSGNTFRYTYNGTGGDPNISATTFPIGTVVQIGSASFTAINNGQFTITGSGTNYFEVTNAGATAENNKALSTGGYLILPQTWTKPAGLKYVVVEGVGAGAGSYGSPNSSAGGASGAYAKKLISAISLLSTEKIIVGKGGLGGLGGSGSGNSGGSSYFSTIVMGKGIKGTNSGDPGTGGTATGGDINISGSKGNSPSGSSTTSIGGIGASSTFGSGGMISGFTPGSPGVAPGSGASGVSGYSLNQDGASGADGIIIITEYYY